MTYAIEIKRFDHLTVFKEITYIYLNGLLYVAMPGTIRLCWLTLNFIASDRTIWTFNSVSTKCV